jgi:indolepyruvate ferredoxin oxidoreductase beta subunit
MTAMGVDLHDRGVTNVVFVGLGGQGVIRASDILADVMFAEGWDVKKAEVHGMSQRGGVVTSDVRFGGEVLSPMVPAGEAHLVVLLDPAAEPWCAALLGPGGRLVSPADVDLERLPSKRALNVALLGATSLHLPAPAGAWEAAIRRAFRPAFHDANLAAFALGRERRGAP